MGDIGTEQSDLQLKHSNTVARLETHGGTQRKRQTYGDAAAVRSHLPHPYFPGPDAESERSASLTDGWLRDGEISIIIDSAAALQWPPHSNANGPRTKVFLRL